VHGYPSKPGVNSFRLLGANIDTDLPHDLDSKGMNLIFGFESGAHRLESVTVDMAEQSFSHLAAGRVASTEKQDVFFLFHNSTLLNVDKAATNNRVKAKVHDIHLSHRSR
jgi:hypothetical protein